MNKVLLTKKTINKFGKHYLLGINKEGKHIWLEEPSWDCGWYWGFGYLHEFTNDRQPTRSSDIMMHTHFDSLFMYQPGQCTRDAFKDYFEQTVLTDDEIWELCDYMMTFYQLKSVAELFKHGYSHQTERAKIEALEREDERDLINKEWLPEVFKRITKLLAPEE